MTHRDQQRIGNISNYYGTLEIRRKDGGGWEWGIEDYYITKWEEIPTYLVDALIAFDNESNKEEQ